MPRSSSWVVLGPWVLFAAGWVLEAWVDDRLRTADGLPTTGGLARHTWFGIHIALAALTLVLAWACLPHHRWPTRSLILALQLLTGFPLYVLACLAYGIAAGIDHL